MSTRTLTLIIALPLLAACTDSEPVAPTADDAASILAAKGGKPGKPGSGDGDSFSYTITDLGEGFAADVNDSGLIVGGAPTGSADFRATQWINTGGEYSMELLGDGQWESGAGSWTSAVNASGDAVGTIFVDAAGTSRAALWSGGGVELLPLLDPAHEESQAYGINDDGQISGQSHTPSYDPARAVRWEPDGSVTDLGVLPGYKNSIGWAINELGWVGGSSRPADSEFPAKRQHAVLWIVESDGSIALPLDLHPVPEIWSIVKGISDVTADGKVYVVGTLDSQGAVWVVDFATRLVIDVQLQPDGGVGAVNEAGEALVGSSVWTLAGNLLDPLPLLSSKQSCNSGGSGINNDGMVVGRSVVWVKGRCREEHAVLWTKKN